MPQPSLAERRAAWAEERRQLEILLDLDPVARARRLAELEAHDSALADRLSTLVESAQEPAGILDQPIFRLSGDDGYGGDRGDGDGLVGSRLGAWKIDREIGRGGAGVVYAAHRADGAFTLQVALKVLQQRQKESAFATAFRLEREILARLEHPSIARILDGGTTPDGRPFLVMELLAGTRVDRWAEHEDTISIVRAFSRFADALAHAHSRNVVHCDLKPAHFLVGADQGARLIDFGIACLDSPDDKGPFIPALTRAFASPEQMRGQKPAAASDIYSFTRVFEASLDDRFPGGYEGRDLKRLITRGLDPDPDRRPTAADFATELVEWLDAPSRRRRRWRLSALAALFVGLSFLTALFSREAHHERQTATEVESFLRHSSTTAQVPLPEDPRARLRALVWAGSERLEKGQIEHARPLVHQALSTLETLPRAGRAEWLDVGELLIATGSTDRAERAFRGALQAGAEDFSSRRRLYAGLGTTARMRGELGKAWHRLSKLAPPSPVRGQLGRLAPSRLGLSTLTPSSLRAERWLAAFLIDIGRPAEASSGLEEALAKVEASPLAGDLVHASLLIDTAFVRAELGDFIRARELAQRSKGILRRQAPPAHPEWARAITLDALVHLLEGDSSSAVRASESAVKLYDEGAQSGPAELIIDVAGALQIRCAAETQLRQLDRARGTCRQALEQLQRQRGPDHPNAAALKINLAKIAALGGDIDGASKLTDDALEGLRALPMEANLNSGLALNYQALTAAYRGHWGQAAETHRQALEVLEASIGQDSPTYAFEIYHFGLAQLRNNRPAAAAITLQEVRRRLEPMIGSEHPRLAWLFKNLAQAYQKLGQLDDAKAALSRAADLAQDQDRSLVRQIQTIEQSLS